MTGPRLPLPSFLMALRNHVRVLYHHSLSEGFLTPLVSSLNLTINLSSLSNLTLTAFNMAATSYYDAPGNVPGATQAQPHFQPPNTHLEGNSQSQSIGQHINSEQRGYPQQSFNGQNSAGYGGQEQQMTGQHQGAPAQQMNGGVGQQAAQPDNRDTLTKCNDNPPDYMIEIERHHFSHFAQEKSVA